MRVYVTWPSTDVAYELNEPPRGYATVKQIDSYIACADLPELARLRKLIADAERQRMGEWLADKAPELVK